MKFLLDTLIFATAHIQEQGSGQNARLPFLLKMKTYVEQVVNDSSISMSLILKILIVTKYITLYHEIS
jgi:hypothetical protein